LNFIKRIGLITIAFVLLLASVPFQAQANNTFKTDLVNGLVTKSDRLTFDLWAKDANGNKIDASLIEVSNNNKTVAVTWGD